MKKWFMNHKARAGLLLFVLLFAVNSAVLAIQQHQRNVQVTHRTTKTVATSDIDLSELDFLINDFRDQAAFPAYHTWAPLILAAQTKCNDMVARNYWSHTTPDGQTFDINDYKYVKRGDVTKLGENIAEGYDNATDVFSAWVKSKEHLANIIDPDFTDSGLAVCKSDNFRGGGPSLLVVEEFAAR